MKNINPFLSAVLTGGMLALSFPPIPFFFLSFLAFIPLLMQFSEHEYKRKYLLIYITFFIYHSGTNWWIGSWQADSDPYLTASSIILAFVHPFFFMIPFGLFFIVKKRISLNCALWSFPFFWTFFEWLHNLGEFSYPWLTIGNTQIFNYYWIQFIDITGVWGASFLIVLFNVIIIQILRNIDFNISIDTIRQSKFAQKMIISLIAIIILPIIYGLIRTQSFQHEKLMISNKIVSVGIIQPSINPWRKWEMSVDEMIKQHFDICDSLILAGYKPDLVIWNETAVPKYINVNNPYDLRYLQLWVDKNNVQLFTGFSEIEFYDENTKTATARKDDNQEGVYYEPYNSSVLIKPNSEVAPESYRKMRLTPMAERLPYADKIMFMKSWFEWGVGISSWGIGKEQKNLKLNIGDDSASLGPIICIESIYPEFVSNTSQNGAEFLIIITNDAWYDYTPGPEQHYLIAAVRAIENRRYIARCANTGVSGVISATGRSINKLPQYQRLGLYEELPLLKEKTIYSILGDWLGFAVFIYTFIVITIAYTRKKLNF
ncbi:MAG: apolipoprotein N-acyltransferase [Candidatus Kapabacteria bacterium]|nr:apolipoprotein N-acyltransferase [Ignavibacteriota bacterium]MCW5884683.1 apolipoprotein N-acyltransferase [Candidatus Kapabacteria bacterium]